MKIITSSANFHTALKQAFDVGCHCISKGRYVQEIEFVTSRYKKSFCYSAFEIQDDSEEEVYEFDNFNMAKLYNLLISIREQPVILTLTDDTIEVKGIIHTIK